MGVVGAEVVPDLVDARQHGKQDRDPDAQGSGSGASSKDLPAGVADDRAHPFRRTRHACPRVEEQRSDPAIAQLPDRAVQNKMMVLTSAVKIMKLAAKSYWKT